MEERLSTLLRAVVEEYVTTAEPVGSQTLVARYRLDVSPATVRNWFAELEEEGCLMQPHTSGGRVPTEKGFRDYVARFVEPKFPGKRDREAIAKAALVPDEDGRRMKSVAKMVAELSGQAVVVGLQESDTFYTGLSQLFVQPEFKNWQRVVSLSEVLDHLDEGLNALRRRPITGPQILIGRECPFGIACGTVLAMSGDALVGILGPIRMDYQHALSLLQGAMDALEHTN